MTQKEKARYFDYLAAKLKYGKILLSHSGINHFYLDENTPEELAKVIEESELFESEFNEESRRDEKRGLYSQHENIAN